MATSGCKKETRIERNLWKKGGEWNIETFYSESEGIDSDGSHYHDFNTEHNAGTLTFKKDGSGMQRYTDGNIESFTYSNTEKILVIKYDYDSYVHDITEWKKGRLTLSTTYNDGMNKSRVVITLKKK